MVKRFVYVVFFAAAALLLAYLLKADVITLQKTKVIKLHKSNAIALHIVTSVEPLALLVKEIGGDHVRVSTLLSANQDPHSSYLKPSQLRLLKEADMVLWLGMEAGLDRAMLRLTETEKIRWLSEADSHHPDHTNDGLGTHEEHDHGDNSNDTESLEVQTHPWLNRQAVHLLAKRLSEKMSALGIVSQERVDELALNLQAIDESYSERDTLRFIADHDAYRGLQLNLPALQLASIKGAGHGQVSAKHLMSLHHLDNVDVLVTGHNIEKNAESLARSMAIPIRRLDLLAQQRSYVSFSAYYNELIGSLFNGDAR